MSEIQDESDLTMTIGIRFDGPITRSTLNEGPLEPRQEKLGAISYWSFCVRLQAKRLIESVSAEGPFLGYFGRRPSKNRRIAAQTSYDLHGFLLACGNLERNLIDAPNEVRVVTSTRNALRLFKLLRNIQEHWDEQRLCYGPGGEKKGASKKLEAEFPGVKPGELTFDPATGDLSIGQVPLQLFAKELRILEASALRMLRKFQD